MPPHGFHASLDSESFDVILTRELSCRQSDIRMVFQNGAQKKKHSYIIRRMRAFWAAGRDMKPESLYLVCRIVICCEWSYAAFQENGTLWSRKDLPQDRECSSSKEKSPAASGWGFSSAQKISHCCLPARCRNGPPDFIRGILKGPPEPFFYFAASCQPVAGVYLIHGPLRVFTLA